jgi:hypothetical protein
MRTMTMLLRRSRAASLALALFAGVTLTACSDFLEVTNPGAIENPALESPNYLQLMYDGVVGDFQPAFAWTALFSGAFTDELRMHHTFFENLEMDQRRVTDVNATYALAIFNGLHRARFLADSVSGRYRTLLGDTVGSNLNYAKTLALASYTWDLLGENICETRIGGAGPALQPDELFTGAIERANAAIVAATEARAAAANIVSVTIRNRTIAGADSALNLARVAGARAALNKGDNPTAVALAQAVTPAYVSPSNLGFRYDVFYKQGASSTETRRMGNPFWEFVSAGGAWVSISGTGYENLNDPRVPHGLAGAVTVQGGGAFFVPNSPRSFGTFNNQMSGALFTAASSMRLASAIEARYILAEAQGNTAANVAFLNEQRAIGGMAELVAPDLATYRAALRVQRAREFFIDGHRLGDLRRYEARQGVDLWPTGSMYGTTTTYGDQKCWITPVSEKF